MFSFSSFWEFDAPSMNQKPGKGNFKELVSKKIPGGACPRASLEAWSLGPSFRKSVSIYPRSAPANCLLQEQVLFILYFKTWPIGIVEDSDNEIYEET